MGARRTEDGFTLIELLIVVVIIGILASIAIPKFAAVRDRAYRAAMMSDLKNVANLQEVYYNDNFTYTTSLTNLEAIVSDGITLVVNEATNTGWAATATHAAMTTAKCGVYHGNATPSNGDPATTVGMVTCNF